MEGISSWVKYLYYSGGLNTGKSIRVERLIEDIKSKNKPTYNLQMRQYSLNNKEMYYVDREEASKIDRDFIGGCLTKTRENIEKGVSFENIDRDFYEDHLFDYLFFQRVFLRQYDSCSLLSFLEEGRFEEDGPIQNFQIVDKIAEKALRRLEEAFEKDLREGRGLKNFVYFKPYDDEIRKAAFSSIKTYGLIGLVSTIGVQIFYRYTQKHPFWGT